MIKDKKINVKLYIARLIVNIIRNFLFFLLYLFYSKIDAKKHSFIITESFYSPWKSDKKFQKTLKQIKKNTKLDHYRLYSLWELIEEISNLNGDIIEIGTWRGGSGCLIAKKINLLNLKSKIYLFDSFTGVKKVTKKDHDYLKKNQYADASKKTVIELIKKMNLKNTEVIKGIFPDDFKKKFRNKKFAFCHLDLDSYESTKGCYNWVWNKMVKNGIIVFDDYGYHIAEGVTSFVNKIKKNNDNFFFYNLTGQAIIIKK